MLEIEIRDRNDVLIGKERTPFVPRIGDYISIERDGVYSYYDVKEVWLRLQEGSAGVACVLVDLSD